jgi:predicted PolB exonuclease-like 3'-5' exonuclease
VYKRQTQAHLDLQDFIGNQGATHVNGGLNLCAQLIGAPGKMDTKGSMVQDLWERGERERIDDYCQCDALDTYFVFLRTRVLTGHITLAEERRLVTHAQGWIEQQAAHSLALAEYRRTMRDWQPPGSNED